MFEVSLTGSEDWLPPVAEAPAWLDEELDDLDAWTDAEALTAAADLPAGARQLLTLMQVDPAALSPDEAVTFAQQVMRLSAFMAGFEARALAAAEARLVDAAEVDRADRSSGFVTAEMLASAEMAAALRVSPRAMDAQLEHARDLAGPMAPLRDALEAGSLSAAHAMAIARELTRLPSAGDADRAGDYTRQCRRILATVIPYAITHTAGQSARRTKVLALTIDPVAADERRRDAAERDHGVWLTPTRDGSCELTAVLPLAHGYAVMDAISTLAKDPRFETADGCVTAGQRRVAALVTLTLGDPGTVARIDGPVAEAKITAHVNVIVPLATLLTEDPAAQGGTLAGEPVTADAVRDALVDVDPTSIIRRLVTDASGCIVDAGRTRYAISGIQRHLIGLRDGRCRFPGCSRRAERCEVDHACSWNAGGRTDLDNLGPLCKHHHQLKTHGGWAIIESHRTGACTWRSPLGRIYQHDPPPLVPPRPVPPEPDDAPPPF